MDHDANGVAVPFERSTSVQRKVRTRKSQRPSKVDDSSPLPSAPPADDSVSIASEILGTPSIDAYEGGDEEDGGSDNMEPSMANDNEYPNIPENGSEFSTAQENYTRTAPSTQIPPNLPRKENLDSESPSPIDPDSRYLRSGNEKDWRSLCPRFDLYNNRHEQVNIYHTKLSGSAHS
jgi:hypothetical protein